MYDHYNWNSWGFNRIEEGITGVFNGISQDFCTTGQRFQMICGNKINGDITGNTLLYSKDDYTMGIPSGNQKV